MQTLITSTLNNPEAAFDKRFGRAAWFCIYDNINESMNFIENEHANDSNGAGTKVAEKAVEWKVTKVISGDFGPKAKELLDKFDIQMVITQEEDLSINDIIQKLKQKR